MMSILQANRIRSKSDENKITPFIIIEEPESFLHPSAQAEFGRVLIDLANELKIQTIVTTHSPYMLCQQNVQSNILLNRRVSRGKIKETEVIEVEDSTWMEPFSKILGLDNSEFSVWKNALKSDNQSLLLVEGDIDKSYLEYIGSLGMPNFSLPKNLDIIPYDGKDSLRNTILLKFIIQKFKKVLVTFDLDAKDDLEKVMKQIGLKEGENYIAVGVDRVGRKCMEGLIPDRIHAKVYSQNPDLVMKLSSGSSGDRRSAKSELKKKILNEFKNCQDIKVDDLKNFHFIFKVINKLFS